MMSRERTWVAGRMWRDGWEILGIYTEERLAVMRCQGPEDFVGQAELDDDLPDQSVPWPDAYHPHSADEQSPYTLADELGAEDLP